MDRRESSVVSENTHSYSLESGLLPAESHVDPSGPRQVCASSCPERFILSCLPPLVLSFLLSLRRIQPSVDARRSAEGACRPRSARRWSNIQLDKRHSHSLTALSTVNCVPVTVALPAGGPVGGPYVASTTPVEGDASMVNGCVRRSRLGFSSARTASTDVSGRVGSMIERQAHTSVFRRRSSDTQFGCHRTGIAVPPVGTTVTDSVRCRPRTTRGGEPAVVPTAMTSNPIGASLAGPQPYTGEETRVPPVCCRFRLSVGWNRRATVARIRWSDSSA